jgi:hypothetical protein
LILNEETDEEDRLEKSPLKKEIQTKKKKHLYAKP